MCVILTQTFVADGRGIRNPCSTLLALLSMGLLLTRGLSSGTQEMKTYTHVPSIPTRFLDAEATTAAAWIVLQNPSHKVTVSQPPCQEPCLNPIKGIYMSLSCHRFCRMVTLVPAKKSHKCLNLSPLLKAPQPTQVVVPGLQYLLVTGRLIIFLLKASKVKIDGEEEIKGAERKTVSGTASKSICFCF